MNKNQATEIINLLKSGEDFKSGHYHYGYMYYWYDKSDETFCHKKEDLSTNIFEPTITEEAYTEVEFFAKLIKEPFNYYINGGLSLTIPKSEAEVNKPDNTHN